MIDKYNGWWIITADNDSAKIYARANSYKFIMRKWAQVRWRMRKDGVIESIYKPRYTTRGRQAANRIKQREAAVRAGDYNAAGIVIEQQR